MHRTWIRAVAAIVWVISLGVSIGLTPSTAGLFSFARSSAHVAKGGVATLETVASYVKSLPAKPGHAALAGSVSHEGHWTFVNRAGETITAGSPDELKRVLRVLSPDQSKPDSRIAIYIAEETAFKGRAHLKDLPKVADLNGMIGSESYRLVKQGDDANLRLFAEVRPRLLVSLTERAHFDEALWQLGRKIDAGTVRIIGLEPGGPAGLTTASRLDPGTKRTLIDSIDPDRLRHSFGAIRRQTAVLSGRVDGELLMFKPASGAEKSLLLRDLTAAAEAADVNLVILKSAAARQPGARNWLWQKIDVAGVPPPMERTSLDEVLTALAGDGGALAVTVSKTSAIRTMFEVRRVNLSSEKSGNPIVAVVKDVVSEVAGNIVSDEIEAWMESAERKQELDQRIVPGIPSDWQFGYLGLLMFGLIGWPVTARWWGRLWPPEAAGEYPSRFGYWAASAVRGGAFVTLFLPLAGAFSALVFALTKFGWVIGIQSGARRR